MGFGFPAAMGAQRRFQSVGLCIAATAVSDEYARNGDGGGT